MEGGALAYAAVFVASALLSLVLTPLALRLALRSGVMDVPGGHKAHSSPVPYLGGVAIVLAFAVAVLAAALLRPPDDGVVELAVVLGLASGLAVVGLIDDLRNLGPYVRLAAEIAAAVGLWAVDVQVDLLGSSGAGDAADLALTVIWVVGVTNALNLLDNMDGLSAGTSAIAAGGFFVIAGVNGQFLVAGLAAGLAGCALGFLRHNFHPARIYMGDAGALFLGFLLAYLGMKLRFDAPTSSTFLVPLLVLGVPIFDTVLVTVNRLLHRRSPLQGGRDHTSHRLVRVGLPVPAAVALIYAGGIALAWIALVVSRIDRGSAWMLAGLVLALGSFVAVLLSFVPVYETSRRRHYAWQQVQQQPPEPAPQQGAATPVVGARR